MDKTLHVYENAHLARKWQKSYNPESNKCVSIGDVLAGERFREILFHCSIVRRDVGWAQNALVRVVDK